MHHWLLYECNSNILLNSTNTPSPGVCLPILPTDYVSPLWYNVESQCQRISLAWAIGADLIQDFPSSIAYPLGGPQADFKYFFLQMHYNNPSITPSIIFVKLN